MSWEANGLEPALGTTFTFTPTSNGAQWVEAEAQWPDGRRVFAVSDSDGFNSPATVTVVATDASRVSNNTGHGDMDVHAHRKHAAPLTVNFITERRRNGTTIGGHKVTCPKR